MKVDREEMKEALQKELYRNEGLVLRGASSWESYQSLLGERRGLLKAIDLLDDCAEKERNR